MDDLDMTDKFREFSEHTQRLLGDLQGGVFIFHNEGLLGLSPNSLKHFVRHLKELDSQLLEQSQKSMEFRQFIVFNAGNLHPSELSASAGEYRFFGADAHSLALKTASCISKTLLEECHIDPEIVDVEVVDFKGDEELQLDPLVHPDDDTLSRLIALVERERLYILGSKGVFASGTESRLRISQGDIEKIRESLGVPVDVEWVPISKKILKQRLDFGDTKFTKWMKEQEDSDSPLARQGTSRAKKVFVKKTFLDALPEPTKPR